MPEPIAPARSERARACGPVGCLAAGWIRVGWGAPETPVVNEPTTHPRRAPVTPPALALECDPAAGRPPEPKPPPVRRPTLPTGVTLGPPRYGGMYPGVYGGFGMQQPGSADLPALSARPAPVLSAEELGTSADTSAILGDAQRLTPVVRLYAWGPKSGEWDQSGRWTIRWQWPFGGWADVRSTAVTTAPWTGLDAARRWLGLGTGSTSWELALGDDADHALLLARRSVPLPATTDVLVLETDRAPVDVRPPAGDGFQDVEAAARVAGRWYIATPQAPGELDATVVWLLEGTSGREVARIPRSVRPGRPSGSRDAPTAAPSASWWTARATARQGRWCAGCCPSTSSRACWVTPSRWRRPTWPTAASRSAAATKPAGTWTFPMSARSC